MVDKRVDFSSLLKENDNPIETKTIPTSHNEPKNIKPKKEVVDPSKKREWIETLAKSKIRLNSAWRKNIEEIIEFLLK